MFLESVSFITADYFIGIPDKTTSISFTQLSIIVSMLSTLLSYTIMRVIKLVTETVSSKGKDVLLTSNLVTILLPVINILNGTYIIYSSQFAHNPKEFAFAIVLFALLILVSIFVLFANENDRKKIHLQAENEAMRLQEELMTSMIDQQNEHLTQMRERDHDFRNHLITIQNMMDANNFAGDTTNKYIESVFEELNEVTPLPNIRNNALKAILLHTMQQAKQKNIAFNYHLQYSGFEFMTFPEISTVFSNILNNALEACEKLKDNNPGRFISLSIKTRGQMVLVECKNGFDGKAVEKDGTYQTTKPEAESHGIGLRNIARVVDKHGGYFAASHSNNIFTIYIDLPLVYEN
ncbi:GHKL domain-containing protein [Ruminococcaceae bacterium OttesenSCG-928-A16]|nr:GHKL domain-containing protein [Ruminococcaceae bacterium OttesenSCG-928-A16]